MTGHTERSITCDIGLPDSPYECDEYPGLNHTFAALRAEAATQGWTRRDGMDFCPKHSRPKHNRGGGNRG